VIIAGDVPIEIGIVAGFVNDPDISLSKTSALYVLPTFDVYSRVSELADTESMKGTEEMGG
jgi:hypothetical protein